MDTFAIVKATHVKTSFPVGDGKPDCITCRGRGVVSVPDEELPQYALDATRPCICVRERDLLDHIDIGWKGLSKIKPVSQTPLTGKENQNLWVTSTMRALQEHLVCLARTKGFSWSFKVITDLDLMTTWLYSANEVLDPDVSQSRKKKEIENTYARIPDLVEPWDLCIIRLGVKTARNVAAPEVFLESLMHREQIGKPTWVVDMDSYPLRNGHIDWNHQVQDFLDGWEKIQLGPSTLKSLGATKPVHFDMDVSDVLETRTKLSAPITYQGHVIHTTPKHTDNVDLGGLNLFSTGDAKKKLDAKKYKNTRRD